MGLRELNLKAAYYSDEDDLLGDFYIPALASAVEYDRIAGYFSSNSLAVAARGIAMFIRNAGKMRLISSVVLSTADQEAIREALRKKETEVLAEIENIEDELKKDHVRMLAWMLTKGLLEMRIAVVKQGIEHQKIGVLKDADGQLVVFNGSENETAHGWLFNDEQFHVYCAWKPGDLDHLQPDMRRFECLWNNNGKNVRVYEVSEAFKRGFLQNAPHDDAEFAVLSDRTDEAITERLYRPEARDTDDRPALWEYQIKAIDNWFGNGRRGILEMATGTGKTFTALGCLRRLHEKAAQLITVIAVPYGHLIPQWRAEAVKFGFDKKRWLIADSTNTSWRNGLADRLTDLEIAHIKELAILTTHDTFSSRDFVEILSRKPSRCQSVLLADEVHSTGAPKLRKGLQDFYDCRLGLSATPRRWFDDLGTKAIYDYFGDVVFAFPLEDAIGTLNPKTGRTYLTPYEYRPVFVSLSETEIRDYIELTHSMVARLGASMKDVARDELMSLLAFKRAAIVKNAHAKFGALDQLLGDQGGSAKGMIIYCSPEQIDEVMRIVNRHRIVAHRFTMSEDFRPSAKLAGRSERELILERFAEGTYEALVAMKCLDEGVDVPPATTAVLMASSGNPREYIQRIGRVLRHYPGKELATIYDFVVVPSLEKLPASLRKFERAILAKELGRYEDIAGIAVNSVTVLRRIYEVKEISTRGH